MKARQEEEKNFINFKASPSIQQMWRKFKGIITKIIELLLKIQGSYYYYYYYYYCLAT